MYLNTITTCVDQTFEIWLAKMLYRVCDTTWHCILSNLPFSDVFSSYEAMYFHCLMSNVLHWWLPSIHFHFRPPSWPLDHYFIWILATFTQVVFLSISSTFKINISIISFRIYYLKQHPPKNPRIFLSLHFYCQLITKSYRICHLKLLFLMGTAVSKTL